MWCWSGLLRVLRCNLGGGLRAGRVCSTQRLGKWGLDRRVTAGARPCYPCHIGRDGQAHLTCRTLKCDGIAQVQRGLHRGNTDKSQSVVFIDYHQIRPISRLRGNLYFEVMPGR